MSTSQKICLVTGASRGIGKGIALALCKAGHKVYITGRTKVVTKKLIYIKWESLIFNQVAAWKNLWKVK